MTPEIISVLTSFASLFTRPTWKNINTLFIGAILCRGARRITSILRVMGLSEVKNFSKYHRVLSRFQPITRSHLFWFEMGMHDFDSATTLVQKTMGAAFYGYSLAL